MPHPTRSQKNFVVSNWTFIVFYAILFGKGAEENGTMLANFEQREHGRTLKVWAGKYRNLQNLPHWHLEYELISVENGSADISCNNQFYELSKGSVFFVEAGSLHSVKGSEDSILSTVLADAALLPPILLKRRLTIPLFPAERYGFFARTEEIRAELKHQALGYEWKAASLLTSFFIDLFRTEATVPKTETPETATIAAYKHLLQEIDKNYSYITFSEAASIAGLSEAYFSRYFRKLSGMTFSHYLNTVRVEKAISMLRDVTHPLPVTDIASQCGFDTIRHFNRVFKEITGSSPKRLPDDFVLEARPIPAQETTFNPTLTSSELLSE